MELGWSWDGDGGGREWTYTTACIPAAPPQPISTMENVKVEITKPRKPKGVAFAYFPTRSFACGVLGARYSFSNSSGLIEMLVDVCARCGSLSMRSESVLCEVTVVVAMVVVVGMLAIHG